MWQSPVRAVPPRPSIKRGIVAGPEPQTTLATFRKQHGKVMFAQNVIHDRAGSLDVGARVDVLATKGA